MLDLKINQLRNSPTYMTKTDPFAIDLTFTSRPSLTTEYLSLSSHENLFADSWQHIIAFGKINLDVPLPPPYTSYV